MLDAYSHLDMEHPDPIADLGARMHMGGVTGAIVVETWDGANRGILEAMLSPAPAPPFRIALCYREAHDGDLRRFLGRGALAGVRMSTADIEAAGDICGEIGSAGALLIAHAESGIGALCRAILRLRRRFPDARIYVPHLGWPANARRADADWQPAIRELAAIPSLLLGVSAIAHFSTQAFPHEDVREWALYAASQFPAARVAVASDYPLFRKDRYAEYMSLARQWVTSVHPGWNFAL